VVVRAGNAGVVRVFVNGQDQGRMGNVGQVVTQRFGQ
jgi:cytoskeleton protein RodZ